MADHPSSMRIGVSQDPHEYWGSVLSKQQNLLARQQQADHQAGNRDNISSYKTWQALLDEEQTILNSVSSSGPDIFTSAQTGRLNEVRSQIFDLSHQSLDHSQQLISESRASDETFWTHVTEVVEGTVAICVVTEGVLTGAWGLGLLGGSAVVVAGGEIAIGGTFLNLLGLGAGGAAAAGSLALAADVIQQRVGTMRGVQSNFNEDEAVNKTNDGMIDGFAGGMTAGFGSPIYQYARQAIVGKTAIGTLRQEMAVGAVSGGVSNGVFADVRAGLRREDLSTALSEIASAIVVGGVMGAGISRLTYSAPPRISESSRIPVQDEADLVPQVRKAELPIPPDESAPMAPLVVERETLITLGLNGDMEAVQELASRASTSPVDMMYVLKLVKNKPELAPAVREMLQPKILVRCPEDLQLIGGDTPTSGMKNWLSLEVDNLHVKVGQLRIDLGLHPPSVAKFDSAHPQDAVTLLENKDEILYRILDSRWGGSLDIRWRNYRIVEGSIDNTTEAAKQLGFLLALKKEHPVMATWLTDPAVTPKTFDAQPLINAKVAENTKVIDMGCGFKRAFARTAADLGADVYTVALEPFTPHSTETLEAVATARARHLQLDLRRPDALDIIRFMFGDNFDLVTEANLINARGPSVREMALSLLKNDGGIYFYVDEDRSRCYITRPAP